MSKFIPAPPPGDMSWMWYRPDGTPFDLYAMNYCHIDCKKCNVNFRVPRKLVRIRCFACGQFKKRPYSI